MLYRKGLYNLALNLAKTRSLDPACVADIHRQYGDHLYAKGDYDGAMQQFVKTTGHLQPSYVIRKVLLWSLLLPLYTEQEKIVVSRRSKDTQSCDVLARLAFSWSCKFRSYHLTFEHIHEIEGCDKTGYFHQNRIASVQ